uniref:Uncharacterized protein n=1 Tax=Arundo donax TaxID=35708 RepID=A0A0A8Z964_ARUDO
MFVSRNLSMSNNVDN